MIHRFKFGAHRYIFDSVSCTVKEVDELGYKMIDYISLPMAPFCPSALRYDLAKYDSVAISSTYDMMLALNKENKLFADEENYDVIEPEKIVSGAGLIESGNGLVVTDGELCGEALEEKLKELDKMIKSALKENSGNIFAPIKPFEHRFACCKDCFARNLCSLTSPGAEICQLEKKRTEASLAFGD